MSNNLLNDSQAHKQEDELAMKFFAKEFLIRASEIERFDLFLCLLPMGPSETGNFRQGVFANSTNELALVWVSHLTSASPFPD
jgi:hypothetical protein